MRRYVVLLAWYFAVLTGHGYMVGPFWRESDCQAIRANFERTYEVTKCWEGPR